MLNQGGVSRLADDDHFPIVSSFSQAIHAGLPLESALRALAEQTSKRKTRNALIELSEHLEQGMPLTEAIERHSAGLPRQMRVLVKAGIESGHIDSIMRYYIEQLQRAASLRRNVLISFSYPAFVIWFSTFVCGFILTAAVPEYAKIFDDFGTELPTLTLAFIKVSQFLLFVGKTNLLIAGLVTLALILNLFVIGTTSWGQAFLIILPGFNKLFRFASLTDFCQILAAMTDAGLPLTRAIELAGEGSDDTRMRRQCRRMMREIDNGVSPSQSAQISGFPNTLCQVFRETAAPRPLADALRGLSELYAAQCQVASQLANTAISQFMVIFVLIFAGVTALALFLPLIKLLNDLS